MKAPECSVHDERPDLDECEACISWMAGEEAYWSAYFGGPAAIKARVEAEKFYAELGIDISNSSPETMAALKELK